MSSSFNGDNEMTSSLTASFFMASALCFHFFGYEMARAASIALLAAKVFYAITLYFSYTDWSPTQMNTFISQFTRSIVGYRLGKWSSLVYRRCRKPNKCDGLIFVCSINKKKWTENHFACFEHLLFDFAGFDVSCLWVAERILGSVICSIIFLLQRNIRVSVIYSTMVFHRKCIGQ